MILYFKYSVIWYKLSIKIYLLIIFAKEKAYYLKSNMPLFNIYFILIIFISCSFISFFESIHKYCFTLFFIFT